MAFLKYVFVFVALFAGAWAVSNSWGFRNPTDILLTSTTVSRNPMGNTAIVADVVFPAHGQYNNRTITAINVWDRFANNSGSTNTIISGGVGYRLATVRLRSQYGRGMNSVVEMYGRR